MVLISKLPQGTVMVAHNNSATLDIRLVVSVQLDMSTCLTVSVVYCSFGSLYR